MPRDIACDHKMEYAVSSKRLSLSNLNIVTMIHIFFISLFFTPSTCLDNGLALTPPMGWLAWQRYRCNIDCKDERFHGCINETLFMRMADKMVADGYKAAGYQYVNIDDCWSSKKRDSKGNLQADPERFPSGIKKLAKYIHNLGLKIGIYGDFGTLTCGGYPGSKYYLERDANTFASWDIDMLKLDGCYTNRADMKDGYPLMSTFLNRTGRPILYSCSWPAYLTSTPPYADIAKYCNIWRNYGDIQDSWSSVSNIIDFYGKDHGNFSAFAGPGHFNDPDMVIIGDYGLSYDQQRSQMALWAMMASPIFMSVDLYRIPQQSRDILLNKGAIAVNQDRLGIQGKRVKTMHKVSVWTRPILPTGTWAIAVLNQGDSGLPKRVAVRLVDLHVNRTARYSLYDVFTNKLIGTHRPTDTITVMVNPSGVSFMKAVPVTVRNKMSFTVVI